MVLSFHKKWNTKLRLLRLYSEIMDIISEYSQLELPKQSRRENIFVAAERGLLALLGGTCLFA